MTKPRVALVYPHWLEERTHTEDMVSVPMGTYAVAAACLEAGQDARVFDWHAMAGREDAMRREFEDFRPHVVGFTVLQANRFGALEAARVAREALPGVKIVFGGVSATALWEFFLRTYREVDAVALGEGDLTMPELVDTWAGGGDPGGVAGLALRGPDGPYKTAERPPVADLDSLPIPARWFTYRHLSLTRGCPGRCTFCGSPAFWGPRVRMRSPRHFVDEMQLLVERGVDFLYVSDDTFTLDRRRVLAVCDEIVARGLKVEWQAISRVNAVDAEVLAAMRRAGCIQVSYGVESGDEGVRGYLNKNIREEDVVRAFAQTHAAGMLARAYFIYGCPGDGDGSVERTLALMDRIRPLVAHFFILSIFPGTELYERFKAESGATDDIWADPIEDIKHFETDPAMSLQDVEAMGERLRRGYHERLAAYAESIELAPDPALAVSHADFLARLGMTFHQGDYARDPLVPDAAAIAEGLYRRALDLFPDAAAALGLGLMLQKRRDYVQSVRVLALGLTANEGHPKLAMALAVSLMNLGDFSKALAFLEPLGDEPQARHYAELCRSNMRRG